MVVPDKVCLVLVRKRYFFASDLYAVCISIFCSLSVVEHLPLLVRHRIECFCGNCLHSFKQQLQRAASCAPPVVFFPQMAPSSQQVCLKSVLVKHGVLVCKANFQWHFCQNAHAHFVLQFSNDYYDHHGKPKNLGMSKG